MFQKIIVAVLIVFTIISCGNKQDSNYITIKGLIAKNDTETIYVSNKLVDKRIDVELDGSFSDTLHLINSGKYRFTDGKNEVEIYIKNGGELNLQYDYTNFNKTIQFTGSGSGTTEYLFNKKKVNKEENLNNYSSFFKLNPKEFNAKLKSVERKFNDLLAIKNVDSTIRSNEVNRNNKFIEYLKINYAKKHQDLLKFKKGNVSPKFVNYENYKGGKTSLDNFKGKFVYIDIWATWCGPCKREIPALKKLTEKYKNKKIEFVSISVDNGRGYKNDAEQAKLAWKRMIKSRNMKGVQLYADNAWRSSFIKEYGIRSIPRFILIDKEGNIIDANAQRPSSKLIEKTLDNLLIN